MGYFICRALIRGHGVEGSKAVFAAFIIAGLYGLSDELHQEHVPTRSAEAMDILSDFIGGFIGGWLAAKRRFN
jgi:VanZ family protein